ncbi:unnamed protein product [Schistosoma rodhaini]|uniref:NADH:ubiquinone oxidoreductase intermediate-associated protein 30 domain-containing protein n=1 Tax=Schistosoma rodhaini TaxID=6188 RepID=A0AA85FF37_9TREM|nr:unnamed protein product [Schistosoma rodhaini]
MNINSLLATTFFILSLHASNAAHMNTNLTAPLTIGITTFYANKQPIIKSINQINRSTGPVLFNFTDSQNKRGEWYEISETVRVEERSDATLVQHVTYNNQSSIFFYPLKILPDRFGSSGVKYIVDTWDLSEFTDFLIDVNGNSKNSKFKFTIYGKCSKTFECQSYETNFQISGGRQQIKLPFRAFKAKFRGAQYSDSLHSFLRQVTRLRIQAYVDHNAPKNEFGPGSIEIHYITARKLKPTTDNY